MERERRTLPLSDVVTLRMDVAEETGVRRIEGRAAVYNVLSEDLGGFRERISPGFFDGALEVSDVRGLFNHDPSSLLARSSSGTLRLTSGESGLDYSIPELADTSVSRDVAELIQRGDLTGNSFSFTIREGGDVWEDQDGMLVRTLLPNGAEELFDVGPVTYPAYPQTDVTARCLELAVERGQIPNDVATEAWRLALAQRRQDSRARLLTR